MKKLRLARYGGLSAVRQKHYTTNYQKMGFHDAPERYGFYAFLFPYIDLFLLTGETGKLKNGEFKKKRDKIAVPYKKFSVEGDIWTHIYLDKKYRYLIKDKRGKWFKINSNDFIKIFKKEYAKMTGEYIELITHNYKKERVNNIFFTVKNPYKLFSTDYLEIFVPRSTKILNF